MIICLFILFFPSPIGDETMVNAYACNLQFEILNFFVVYFY